MTDRTAFLDQLEAAKRETALMRARAAKSLDTIRAVTYGGAVGCVVEQWRTSSLVEGCSHLSSPTPSLGLFTSPGIAYCTPCGLAALDIAVLFAPDRCDACGKRSRLFRDVILCPTSVLNLVGMICPACFDSADDLAVGAWC